MRNKKIFIFVLSLGFLLSNTALSDESQPRWNFDLNVAKVEPKLDDWNTYYDREPIRIGLGLGYKITRQIEVSTTVAFITKEGKGDLPLNNSIGGEVTLDLIPLDISLIYRLILKEEQQFIPYIGGGWSRIYYRQTPQDGDEIKGAHDGHHFKFGLQYLLDPLDKKAANQARQKMGVDNTYLFVEALSVEAEENGIDLGGNSIAVGIMIEG